MINLEKLNQIEERFEYLEAKLTQQLRADEIRDELASMGVVVEDGPDGPAWRLT